MKQCTNCRAANDADAVYCEQCGWELAKDAPAQKAEAEPAAAVFSSADDLRGLIKGYRSEGFNLEAALGLACQKFFSAAEPSAEEDARCDCGGVIKEVAKGKGICQNCGASFIEAERPGELVDPLPGSPAEELAGRVMDAIAQGLDLDKAVDQAYGKFFSDEGPAVSAEAPAETRPCPLCGQGNPKDAAQCSGCRILFKKAYAPCANCGVSGAEDLCSCGAIRTLDKVLKYLGPRVSSVCPNCHQLFEKDSGACSDCGKTLVSAERLKAYSRNAAA